MKSLLKYLALVLLVCGIVIVGNYKYEGHLEYINSKVIDIFFNSRETKNINKNVVVIDIDDKSINEVGQWPWSRNIMANLLQNIIELNPSSIGFRIVFSEEDRTSPSHLYRDSDTNEPLENYDETLGLVIEDSEVPIILGYNFYDTDGNEENHETPYIPAVLKQKTSKIEFYETSSVFLNIPIIQDSSYSSGFLNTIRDDNGRIVYAPLVMQYKGQLFPSLALEMIRTIYSAREVNIFKDSKGNHVKLADIKIPIDNTGSMYVNYMSPKNDFVHISAVDILNKNFNNFLLSDIASKIVLVGSNATGISQFTPTPFNTHISAIDMQVNMIENILGNSYLVKPVWENKFNIIASIIISMLILTSIFYGSALSNFLVSLSSAVISYFVFKHLFDEYGYMIDTTYVIETIILALTVSIIAHFLQNKYDMINIKGKFASKVSKQVMDDLLDTSNRKGDTSTKRKHITIFFSDIKGFTKITEKIDDPDNLTRFINRYMDAMTKNIMIGKGTVDKFMGDAIMAYWNAPYDVDNHEDMAVSSAIEQIDLLTELNEINIEEEMPVIHIRIGINTGEAFVGEVGGELRSDYTVMGKAVNHTAVLEQVGKYYHADIIISQSTKDGLKEDYIILLMDIIQVDGTSDAFNIYQVVAKGKPDEFLSEQIENFEKAIMLFREAAFDDAILIFRNLLIEEDLLNRKLCETYIQRCEINAIASFGGEFDPVQSINKSVISNS